MFDSNLKLLFIRLWVIATILSIVTVTILEISVDYPSGLASYIDETEISWISISVTLALLMILPITCYALWTDKVWGRWLLLIFTIIGMLPIYGWVIYSPIVSSLIELFSLADGAVLLLLFEKEIVQLLQREYPKFLSADSKQDQD
jgi:uncharacterized membrane protein (DUF2068 family)